MTLTLSTTGSRSMVCIVIKVGSNSCGAQKVCHLMGLFGMIFDAVLLTTEVAGVRRATGINGAEMVLKRIKNDTARQVKVEFSGGRNVDSWDAGVVFVL